MKDTKNIYACSYKEVMTILAHLEPQELKKIPKEKIEYFFNNMDTSYSYELNYMESFQEQEMLEVTEAILANLFRDYLATPEQRERIQLKEEYERKELQKKHIEEIDEVVDNEIEQIEEEPAKEELALIEYQVSFLTKIKRWLKSKLHFMENIG